FAQARHLRSGASLRRRDGRQCETFGNCAEPTPVADLSARFSRNRRQRARAGKARRRPSPGLATRFGVSRPLSREPSAASCPAITQAASDNRALRRSPFCPPTGSLDRFLL